MGDRPIKVAIVTPVHNRREITMTCLRSLSRIDSEGLDVSVYIVDDGSTDGTSEAIREEFPGVHVVQGGGDLWFTEGTNIGVREAMRDDPDYVLMINDDAVFDQAFLKCMVETAENRPRSVIGSLLLLWDTPHKLFQVSPVWDPWCGGWRHWNQQTVWTIPDRPWEVDLIVGNCVLVPAGAIRENGLMDSKRFPNFGDAEYTPRLKKAGWKLLIEPRARVFCQPNTPPKRIGNAPLREKYRMLVTDLGHPHNLRRRFYAGYFGAPNRFEGVLAFFMFLFRAATGTSPESRSGSVGKEPALSDTFGDRVAG
jgi:GT2 family glycosyltransferase